MEGIVRTRGRVERRVKMREGVEWRVGMKGMRGGWRGECGCEDGWEVEERGDERRVGMDG
jgi:hypothetical protein